MKRERHIFKHNLEIYKKFVELKAFYSAKLIVDNMVYYAKAIHADRELFIWLGLQYEITEMIAKTKFKSSNENWREKMAANKEIHPLPGRLARGCKHSNKHLAKDGNCDVVKYLS